MRFTFYLLAILTQLPFTAAATAHDLTLVSWGGAYTRSQMLAFVRPFEEKNHIRMEVLDYDGGLAEIRSQVRSLNVRWDIVDLELSDAVRACNEGLLEEIETASLQPAPDGTPPEEDFIEGTLTPCAVGTVIWSTVIAYDRTDFADAGPQKFTDLFDPDRFPGKRGLRYTPKANLEWALLADGVEPEVIYDTLETKQGLDRAFRVLTRIKPWIHWWQAGDEAVRLLETDQVVMTTAYNGRIYDAVTTRNEPFEIIWDRQIWDIDLLGIPRGNPRRQQARDFITFATATRQLAMQAQHISYGPVRHSALQQVAPELRPHLPTAPENFRHALQVDSAWWAEHFDRINRRFEDWASRSIQVPQALPR
ncbi:MAG: extracellular solute-binding protein [Pseudomonadales bacterium]